MSERSSTEREQDWAEEAVAGEVYRKPGQHGHAPRAQLALTGLPAYCTTCAATPREWALTVHGNVLQVTCPECWTAVQPVMAVAATGREAGK